MHLFRRSKVGIEALVASFDFRGVKFFLPQKDGNIYFTRHNNLYRVQPNSKVTTIANNMGSARSMPWGVWQDDRSAVYVALFNDKVINKIDNHGKAIVFYRSRDGWSPAGGVFDKKDRLWILEWSDKNEVRVVRMGDVAKARN